MLVGEHEAKRKLIPRPLGLHPIPSHRPLGCRRDTRNVSNGSYPGKGGGSNDVRKERESVRNVRQWIGVAVLIVVAIIIISSLGSGTSADKIVDAQGDAAAPAYVRFVVTGYAPKGVDITYGSDTSNFQGPRQPPMDRTRLIRSDAAYYDVTAQLNGGGAITCKLIIGATVRVGHARGDYNICSAQLNNVGGGW